MFTLNFKNQVYFLGFQKESLYKPSERLISKNPFMHFSNLYKVERDGFTNWLFDHDGHGFAWNSIIDPDDWEELPIDEYLNLLSSWHTKHRTSFRAKQKIQNSSRIEGRGQDND